MGKRSWVDLLVPLAVLGTGVALSVAASVWVMQGERERARDRFQLSASERIADLKLRVEVAIESIRPLSMLFVASEQVNEREFERFSEEILRRQPAISALAWVPRVTNADRARFERENGARYGAYEIFDWHEQEGRRRSPEREDYFPVEFVTPLAPNRAILGSDLAIVRRPNAAVVRAMRGQGYSVTVPHELHWLASKPLGVDAFVQVPGGEGSGEAGLARGVVMGVFEVRRLVTGEAGSGRGIGMEIIDALDEEREGRHFYTVPDPAVFEAASEAGFARSERIEVGGRTWIIRARALDPALFAVPTPARWLVLLMGIAGAGGLAAFLGSRIGRAQANRLLAQRTRDLREANAALVRAQRRTQQLFDASIDPLWDWDVKEDVVLFSSNWATMMGHPRGALDPRRDPWSSFVHRDDFDRVWARLAACVKGPEDHYEAAYRLRTRSGEYVQVLSRGVVIERAPDGTARRMIGSLTDMTALSTAKASLSHSEERFRQLAENIDSVFWMMTVEPRELIYVSPAFDRIWGRPASYSTELGIAPIDTIHPDDREMARQALEAWLKRKGEGHYDVVYRVIRPDGGTRWVHDRGFAVRNEAGRAYRVAGFAEDITARVQSEAALIESEQRLSALIRQAAVGIAQVELTGRFRFVNQRLCGILDGTESSLLRQTLADITHPEDRPGSLALLERMVSEQLGGCTVEQRYVRGDGGTCWCNIAMSVVRDEAGRAKYFIVIVEDITARRTAEEVARESTERHRLALEAVAGIVYDFDLRTGRVFRSSGLERVLGYAPEELSPGVDAWHGVIHPDDLRHAREEVQAALERAESFEIEYRMIHRQGHVVRILDKGIVQRDAEGRATRVVGCVMDVSRVHEAQRALRASEERNRAILRAVPDHLFHVNREGRYLGWHSNAPDLLVAPPERFLGKRIQEVVPTELAERSARHLERLFASGEPQVFEYSSRRDGVQHHYEVRVVPASADEALILVREITGRKHAELALRESEERYRILFDCMPEPIMVHHGGAVAIGNQAAARLLGATSPSGLAGLNVFDSIVEADREMSRRQARRILETGETLPLWRARIRAGDGPVRTVEIAASRVSFGDQFALLIIARDLTERLRSEELLGEVRDRLTGVLDRLPDVVAYDSSPDRLYVGENAVRLLGRDAAALMGDPDSLRLLIHPEDREHVERRFRQFVGSPAGSSQTLQFRLRRPDGTDVWVEDRMTLLPTASGKRRIVGVFIDITKLKHTEFSLRGMMAERDHRVKNNLASVLAIANHSLRHAVDLGDYHAEFVRRIKALAKVHHALAQSSWTQVEMRTMIHDALSPFQGRADSRIVIEGKDTLLPGRMGPPLALTLHELATNAAKHGALSSADGVVRVTWNLEVTTGGHLLRIRWREAGGPLVAPPTRRGFGRDLIEDGLRHELGATVRLRFEPAGLDCHIEVPLAPEAAGESEWEEPPFPPPLPPVQRPSSLRIK